VRERERDPPVRPSVSWRLQIRASRSNDDPLRSVQPETTTTPSSTSSIPSLGNSQHFRKLKRSALHRIESFLSAGNAAREAGRAATMLTTQQPPDLLSDNKMELSLSYNCFLCPAVGGRHQQRRKRQEMPRLLSFRDEGLGCLTLARLWPIDTLTQALKHHAVNHGVGAELPEQFVTQSIYEGTTAFVRRDASLHASNRAKNKIHNVLLPCPICRLRKNGYDNDGFACCLMCLKDHYGILHKNEDLLHIALATVRKNYGQDQRILKFATSMLDARCVLCLRLFDMAAKKDRRNLHHVSRPAVQSIRDTA
jgi:hypothetical protein